ncbi:MAG: carbamoyltransferase N-terminal domain-containing protein [Candidatus Curtissbacteria bacterium]|nr:carbamoyltransferase N-terminal domain-containing protein [Candidatus Curtissbacteria bacterium]
MYILGISCFYHESAVCLIKDGKILAASAEERFSRKKHDSEFPILAIEFCFKKAGIKIKDVDFVVYYEKPFWKFDRILRSTLATWPAAPRLFAKAMVTWLTDKLWVRSIIVDKLKIDPQKVLFVPHHISHAASAFYPSGYERAAILTFDGVGEWTTTTWGVGEGNDIKIEEEIKFPHSLGLLYSVFTAFLGFEVNDGEYKVMGMAPYGKPKYLDRVRRLVTTYEDGSYRLKMEYFTYHKSTSKAFSQKFVKLFGKPRQKDLHFFTKSSGYPSYFGEKPDNYQELCEQNQKYADIAASIQAFTEERILALAKFVHQKTQMDNLCIAGGVGLNSVANGMLLSRSPFKRIFVQPAAGDDGGSLGAAYYVNHAILGKKRNYTQDNCYFGEDFTDLEIEKFLKSKRIKYRKIVSEAALCDFLSGEIASGKVIGFFHGRAEWGPRALGARSIMADPRREEMKEIVNTKIKFREPYRPFAPVVLAEKASKYFELGNLEHVSLTNFMLAVFPVKRQMRKVIPATVHVDGSGRLQIISAKQNSRYYNLIKKFGQKTGVYVLMNTSFNLKGEPIVNTPANAFSTFTKSGLDILALERYIVLKEDL